jgi:hypothetical protein
LGSVGEERTEGQARTGGQARTVGQALLAQRGAALAERTARLAAHLVAGGPVAARLASTVPRRWSTCRRLRSRMLLRRTW